MNTNIEIKFVRAFATSLVLLAASPMLSAAEDPLKVCIESAVSKLKLVNADQEKLADAKALTEFNVTELRTADEKITAARDAKGDDLVRCNNWKKMIENKASIVSKAKAYKEAIDKMPNITGLNLGGIGGSKDKPQETGTGVTTSGIGGREGKVTIGRRTPFVLGFGLSQREKKFEVEISTFTGLGSAPPMLVEKVCHELAGTGTKTMTKSDYYGDVTVYLEVRKLGCAATPLGNPVICRLKRTFYNNRDNSNNSVEVSGIHFSSYSGELDACKLN